MVLVLAIRRGPLLGLIARVHVEDARPPPPLSVTRPPPSITIFGPLSFIIFAGAIEGDRHRVGSAIERDDAAAATAATTALVQLSGVPLPTTRSGRDVSSASAHRPGSTQWAVGVAGPRAGTGPRFWLGRGRRARRHGCVDRLARACRNIGRIVATAGERNDHREQRDDAQMHPRWYRRPERRPLASRSGRSGATHAGSGSPSFRGHCTYLSAGARERSQIRRRCLSCSNGAGLHPLLCASRADFRPRFSVGPTTQAVGTLVRTSLEHWPNGAKRLVLAGETEANPLGQRRPTGPPPSLCFLLLLREGRGGSSVGQRHRARTWSGGGCSDERGLLRVGVPRRAQPEVARHRPDPGQESASPVHVPLVSPPSFLSSERSW